MNDALLLDNDLFFAVKVSTTLQHMGLQTRTVRRLEDFIEQLTSNPPEIVLVNTAARGIDWQRGIDAAQQANIPSIAFGSHVDIETQQAARQAGATRVIANSRLASDLPAIVERLLGRQPEKSDKMEHETPAPDGTSLAASAQQAKVEPQ